MCTHCALSVTDAHTLCTVLMLLLHRGVVSTGKQDEAAAEADSSDDDTSADTAAGYNYKSGLSLEAKLPSGSWFVQAASGIGLDNSEPDDTEEEETGESTAAAAAAATKSAADKKQNARRRKNKSKSSANKVD
jgi:hypothetical protein